MPVPQQIQFQLFQDCSQGQVQVPGSHQLPKLWGRFFGPTKGLHTAPWVPGLLTMTALSTPVVAICAGVFVLFQQGSSLIAESLEQKHHGSTLGMSPPTASPLSARASSSSSASSKDAVLDSYARRQVLEVVPFAHCIMVVLLIHLFCAP